MSQLQTNPRNKIFTPGSKWLLNNSIEGYKYSEGNELSTQIISGRKFEITSGRSAAASSSETQRIKIKLLEDSYICWIETKDIDKKIEPINNFTPVLFTKAKIKNKIPKILDWIEKASKQPNQYLWGGTIGPNFDCSGLIQTAFAIEEIWIPRDAYQQEKFCRNIEFDKTSFQGILAGDLLFFGSNACCSHVAIYIGNGSYWHSSGEKFGRDGIGIDSLKIINNNAISSHYLSILRGAGRVESCHDSTALD